jgi:tetratricopeptide (TPR) repeat protein
MISSLVLLAASLGVSPSRADASKGNDFVMTNPADLPGHCSADRMYMDTDWVEWARLKSFPTPAGGGADEQAIEALFSTENPDSPTVSEWITKRTDYFARRAEVQKKIEARLDADASPHRALHFENYAYVLAYLGEFKKAIEYFGPGSKKHAEFENDGIVNFILGQSYFRLHRYEEARKHAIAAYKQLPDKYLDTRWQLMTIDLGLYGDKFFKKYSKDYYTTKHIPEIFPNTDESSFPFEIATDKMGIDPWGGTGMINFMDLDGDGWPDLLFQRKFFPPSIYKNVGGRKFELQPEANVESKWCNFIVETITDYNNDGKPDLHRQCCNYDGAGDGVLLKNMGDFKFKDVTKGSNLSPHISGMSTAWGDIDLDGSLDYVATDQYGPVKLFHNNGDGTFTDITAKAGIVTPGGKGPDDFGAVGCAFGDYDGDGYPDMFCNGWGWAKLYHNKGDGTFEDVTKKAGISDGKDVKGYMTFFFDYDNDGKMDIFVGRYVVSSGDSWGFGPRCTCSNLLSEDGYTEREWKSAGTIYRNNGDGTFTDMREQTKFVPLGVMSVNHGDWNNDGYQDLVMGAGGPYIQQAEPFLFYENQGNGTFKNITPFTMLPLWGKGHGQSFADYDHDGNLDLFVNDGGAFAGDVWASMLLHNKGNGNHWLNVSLKGGAGTNSFGVGAKVRVYTKAGQQLQEVASGGRFGSADGLELHFGLARESKADRIVVEWPNKKKTVSRLADVAADQAIEVREGVDGFRTLWTSPRKTAEAGAGGR